MSRMTLTLNSGLSMEVLVRLPKKWTALNLVLFFPTINLGRISNSDYGDTIKHMTAYVYSREPSMFGLCIKPQRSSYKIQD